MDMDIDLRQTVECSFFVDLLPMPMHPNGAFLCPQTVIYYSNCSSPKIVSIQNRMTIIIFLILLKSMVDGDTPNGDIHLVFFDPFHAIQSVVLYSKSSRPELANNLF